MRYSILYFIFTFLGPNILVYGGHYNQQKQQVQDTHTQQQQYQQQQTGPYNNSSGLYHDLASLSNQINQNGNGNTVNNEQTQNIQQLKIIGHVTRSSLEGGDTTKKSASWRLG
jgi:hypothetical protein